jgi:hypothetical protein
VKLLLFPGLWLIATAAVCVARLDATLAGALTFAVGFIAYLVAHVDRTELRSRALIIVKRSAFALGILVVSVLLTRTYYWVTWNPIGTTDDGWGIMPGMIFQDLEHDWPAIPNGDDGVAVVRRTSSGLLSIDSPTSYFVFVHLASEHESRTNLVFRYFATAQGWDSPPQVTWDRDGSVIVLVGVGDILTITKQRHSIDGVPVTYDICAGAHSPELAFWQRPFL